MRTYEVFDQFAQSRGTVKADHMPSLADFQKKCRIGVVTMLEHLPNDTALLTHKGDVRFVVRCVAVQS